MEGAAMSKILDGMWHKYLGLMLKYSKEKPSAQVIEQFKDSFYLGATAMYSVMRAAMQLTDQHHDPAIFRDFVKNAEEELHAYMQEGDVPRENCSKTAVKVQ